ncbi:MAG: hypothetical protein HYX83_02690 [Chloroflexi bacterium]|nr:hypothetical protein [Chloroflexota bacterium]
MVVGLADVVVDEGAVVLGAVVAEEVAAGFVEAVVVVESVAVVLGIV